MGLTLLAQTVWSQTSTLLGILTALVAVPLGLVTFSLKSLHDQQAASQASLTARLDQLETALHRLLRRVGDSERHFTLKEDWLRESMLARHNLDRLNQAYTRLDAALDRADRRTGAAVGAFRGPASQEVL